jgi:protein-disulfide isomerase
MSDKNSTNSLITLAFIIICTAVLSALLTRGLMPASGSENIEAALNDFIVKNPSVIGDAVKRAYEIEQEKAEADAQKNIISRKDELHNDPASPITGNKNGKKVVVEFFDYNCGYCKKMLPDLNAIIEEDKDVKLVLKEIPVLGKMSEYASKISLAVNKNSPEKYWNFHNILLKSGARSKEQIHSVVTKVGLDLTVIKTLAEGSEIAEQLEKNISLATDIGVRGTPAFVANTTLIRGAQGKEAIVDALKE